MLSFLAFAWVWTSALAFLMHAGAKMAAKWAVRWSLLAGFCLLAPWFLNVNHLRPTSLMQWLTLTSLFALTFAALGSSIAVATSSLGAAWAVLRRRDFQYPSWVYAIWSAFVLPPSYMALGVVAEEFGLGRSVPPALRTIVIGGSWWVGTVFATYAVSRSPWARNRDPKAQTFTNVIAGLTLLAILVMPLRLERHTSGTVAAATTLTRRDSGTRAPLLVIGLDGGSWRLMKPALDQGRAPALAKLIASGIHGSIKAEWPPYWSNPAWGAIVTGHGREQLGVYEDLVAIAPGLPPFELPLTPTPGLDPLLLLELVLARSGVVQASPTPRDKLNATPVWERMTKAGVRTAVIRFPFTYPAAGQAEYVISNRALVDLWDSFGVKPGHPDLAFEPPAMAGEMLSIISGVTPQLNPSFEDAVGIRQWHRPSDALLDPLLVMKRAYENDLRMNFIAKRLLRQDPSIAAVMIHMVGIDEVSHSFWQYRFPGDFSDGPAERDVALLGPIVDRFVETFDQRLVELIDAFPADPNVLIVSDHGAEASDAFPPWRGWHASPGVFVAAGPDIAHRKDALQVSYFDVTPTIIELVGLTRATDLPGQSLIR